MNACVYILILQNLYLLWRMRKIQDIYITFSNNLKRSSLKENVVFCLMSTTFPGYPPSGHLPAQS